MKSFEHWDQDISPKMLGYAIVSMTIAVGILTLPRIITQNTQVFDGIISLMAGGVIALFFTYISAKLASRFRKQTFYVFTEKIASKYIAIVLTVVFALFFMLVTAFEVRMLANIAAKYLFDETPEEVISLTFFLVVIYAVSGKHVAILRLNLMFLPIFFAVLFSLLILNIQYLDLNHFTPFFTSSWRELLRGTFYAAANMIGLSIILFYVSFMRTPKKAPKAALIGALITICVNMIIFFFVVGQLGPVVTRNVLYPTIEMAKETKVPGEFFARFYAVFFTAWIMAIFNTTTMSLHVSTLAIDSLFKKMQKFRTILILAPIIFYVSMLPIDIIQIGLITEWLMGIGALMGMGVPALLYVAAILRKVKGNA